MPNKPEGVVIANPAAGTERLTAAAQSELVGRIQADREMSGLKTQGYITPEEAAKILACDFEQLTSLIQSPKFINDCLPAMPVWQHRFDSEKTLLTPEAMQRILDYDKTAETLKGQGYATLIRAAVITGHNLDEINLWIEKHTAEKPKKPEVWQHPLRGYPLLSGAAINSINTSPKTPERTGKAEKEELKKIDEERFYTGDQVKEICGFSNKELNQHLKLIRHDETYNVDGMQSETVNARKGNDFVKQIDDKYFVRGSILKSWLEAKIEWDKNRSKGYRNQMEIAALSGISCADIITQAEKLLDKTIAEDSVYNNQFGSELYSPSFADKVITALEKSNAKPTDSPKPVKRGGKSEKVGEAKKVPDSTKKDLGEKNKPEKKK